MAEAAADHETIRKWAGCRGGKPAAVARTHQGGVVGIVRIMFRDAPRSEHRALTEISREEFFKEFDRRSHGESGASRHEGGATRHWRRRRV